MPDNELATTSPRTEANPMGILQSAIDRGASLEQISTLTALVERWEENAARKAFNVAFSDFKAEAVSIVKNTSVTSGPLNGQKYANLFGVVNAITPAMSKHGLSHSWKLTKDEPAWMEVTCTIRHTLGYSESVSMGAAPDAGPGRNAIQARGSAKSYLERYTLLAATGMAAADTDNDGADTLTDAQQALVKDILASKTKDDLMATYKAAYKTACSNGTVKDQPAVDAYIAAKDAILAQLSAGNAK